MPNFGSLLDARLGWTLIVILKMMAEKINVVRSKNKLNFERQDIVIATSPPYVTLLIGYFWKKLYPATYLILDYRDQFSGNHMFRNRFSNIEKLLDRLFLRQADLILCVSEPMKQYYDQLACVDALVIANGFEEWITQDQCTKGVTDDCLRYFGTITPDRLMEPLWDAISKIDMQLSPVFEFYGDCGILEEFLSQNYRGLKQKVKFYPPVTHREAVELMYRSKGLLFTETSDSDFASQRGVLTTKLFEYLATKRPICGIIDTQTEAGKILLESGLSQFVSIDPNVIKDKILMPFEVRPNAEFIRSFSRTRQFEKIIELLPKHE